MVYFKVLTVASAVGFASWIAYIKGVPKEMEYIEFKKENVKLKEKANIAIIGSGIGGSSAAFFLRNMFGSDVSIDLYEKSNRIGGRMRTIGFQGQKMESGASIIHDSNKYMVSFAKYLGLEQIKAMDDSRLGIWNGDEFVFVTSSSNLLTNIKLLWRYGFFSLWNLDKSLEKMLDNFGNIYSLQDEGNSFKSPVDLVKAQGGEYFVNCTKRTAKDVMKENGLSELLIDELVTGITRCNYGQDTSVNAFTGYVSMAGSGGNLWSVKGGNQQVCEKLINHAECENVNFNTKVVNVHKKTSNEKKSRYVLQTEKGEKSKEYDVIIVASPLEIPSYYFQCSKCEAWPPKENMGARYQRTVATFVRADINPTYFNNKRTEDTPQAVLTTENEAIPFSSVGVQKNVDGVGTVPPIYKIFSREIPSNETLKDLFKSNDVKPLMVDWLAYPKYSPPEKFVPFVLDEGVFYVNSIERVASAMEMSAIGGRNAALLAKKYILELFETN